MLEKLKQRSNGVCELCGSNENLAIYYVPPVTEKTLEQSIVACETCIEQIENPETTDPNHWRCLNDSMWSEQDAVKVVAWRMLNRLKSEGWPQDLLDMMYLEDETLGWAKAGNPDTQEKHVDVNGVELLAGDNVVLVKDLKVKGSSMVAKQGTAVRRISLDPENPEYIEGKVDGQKIVIVTKYVKKVK